MRRSHRNCIESWPPNVDSALHRLGHVSWFLANFVAVLVIATPGVAHAFRTAGELPQLQSATPVRFRESVIQFRITRANPAGLSDEEVQRAAIAAAAQWATPECTEVRLNFLGYDPQHATHGDNINTVEWVSDWAERDLDPSAAGYTDVQFKRSGDGPWEIAEADVYLNATFAWSTRQSVVAPTRSVEAVLTHEFGHLLGLLHPCELDASPRCSAADDPSVTMFPLYSAEQSSLEADDSAGICYLYPVADCSETGCEMGQVCSDGACRVLCGDQVCSRGMICSASGCREPGGCARSSCLGEACQADAQCGELEVCVASACALAGSSLGDICSDPSDCREGLCVDGQCQKTCLLQGECGPNERCEPYDAEHSLCTSSAGNLGDRCESPLGCRGARCLENAKPYPICSQPCGKNLPVCEAGWACGSVDGDEVCVPLVSSGGCAMSPSAEASDWAAIAMLVVGVAARRRQRRACVAHH
jgi:MYXO-CTERM domain-containing protein